MSYDYSVSEDEMQNDQVQQLRRPYNGPVELVDLKFDTDDETFGGNDVIVFTFEAQDEDHIGQQFEHVEWQPSEEDFENEDANGNSDFQLEMRRLVHILQRVLATSEETIREKVVLFQGETLEEAWSNLGLRVQQAFEKFGPTDDVVEAKAFARVNDSGYVNVQFGKYPGFIRVVGEDPKMEFNDWERERNQEAIEALNSDPDDSDDFGEEDDEFDYDVEGADF